ncbi:S8 family peptidase [Bacteroides propionicifaciens]|uniref:S8 family peptidase n=1 Tax=Bacteroides propionicifaciens TaxID=392838 RepID=UPI00039E9B24|nr:S8 family serine peptidase [Bacteroides propionicifaciens]
MHKLLLSLLILLLGYSSNVLAQIDTLKYRISLTDKDGTPYQIDKPEAFLSAKAIERRVKQGISIDETDLPVSPTYVEQIKQLGLRIILTGKWDNFVTVSCNDTTAISTIRDLPFVRGVELVWSASDKDINPQPLIRDSVMNQMDWQEDYYGTAKNQIAISQGDLLHAEGFKGEDMVIAVIDAGFHNMDQIGGMNNINVLGIKDFVNPCSDIYAEHSHGLAVLSCIAMNKPHYMVGTAPKASFWLLRSEDDNSEHLVEQDYWSAAVEFADSVGVDIISTSLGYNEFDDKSKNYEYYHLDGEYALMSRQASKTANKGLILVCSAGNSGMGSWKKLTAPGDARDIITVGAIDSSGVLAPFSSIGNTADNRIKPDVVAVGLQASVMGTDGKISTANGTSFSAPIMTGLVACLWQALPELTAKELIDLLRSVGDRSAHPDNIYGFGIPNVWQAYQQTKMVDDRK